MNGRLNTQAGFQLVINVSDGDARHGSALVINDDTLCIADRFVTLKADASEGDDRPYHHKILLRS